MPRKSTKAKTADEKQAEQPAAVSMVAAGTFESKAHEGRVKAGASFQTSPDRAAFLEARGLARRSKS